MPKRMLVDATHSEETRVAVVENDLLVDFDFENLSKRPLKGNLYLGKIVRIEPSLQAAFVDYGGNRHGFLAFTEIHPDYFRIPVADRPEEEEIEATPEETTEEPALEIPDMDAEDLAEDETPKKEEKKEEKEPTFNPYRAYKIQEVVQSRQVVLVQVVKEERGNKGAALTTHVSLAGRYCVLMPNAAHGGGISRRITDMGDRKRLKQLIQDLEVPDNMSLIVRTAGLDRSKVEIKRDYAYLIKLWASIREQTLKSNAPELIYEEANLLRRAIRDMYTKEVDEILVSGDDAYREVKSFMKDMVPSHAKKVQKFKDDAYPLFYQYKIERQIEKMYSTEVQLKSGGYLVINPTEALISIDVNSGRATRERHIDRTALNTNMEAAAEVARQIRLRDFAGLIVIDFIDMVDPKHNAQVEKCLKESLTVDRARVQVGRISQFGLLEMSRQRLRPSIIEASTVRCSKCDGAGVVRSSESFALQMLRVLEEICLEDPETRALTVHMPSHMAFYLLSEKRHEFSNLESRYSIDFTLKEDDALGNVGFKIETEGRLLVDGLGNTGKKPKNPENKQEKKKKPAPQKKKAKPQREEAVAESTPDNPEEQDKPSKSKRRNNRRRRGKKPQGENAQPSPEDQTNTPAPQKEAEPKVKGARKKGWWQRLLDS